MPRLSASFEQILFRAYASAEAAHQSSVYAIDLLLATVEESEPLQDLLFVGAIDEEKLGNVVSWVRITERLRERLRTFRRAAAHMSKYGIDRAMTAVAPPYLNRFSQDLTLAAKFGYLAPCVAREKEIEEILRVIDGGRQSVVLVGEPGVGKMSIIEGIVERIIDGAVPERLIEKRMVQLSTSALLAGATVAGAEERLMKMMHEIHRAKNIVLFINNIQDLVSINAAEGEEGLDVAKSIAEYISSGRVSLFATATPEGYNRHIVESELGSQLARIDVREVGENQAIRLWSQSRTHRIRAADIFL